MYGLYRDIHIKKSIYGSLYGCLYINRTSEDIDFFFHIWFSIWMSLYKPYIYLFPSIQYSVSLTVQFVEQTQLYTNAAQMLILLEDPLLLLHQDGLGAPSFRPPKSLNPH